MKFKTRANYLIGIIPIASQENIFNMPWHDCLMPLSENYLAIEHAVFTCALAGCKSIWIVGHMDMQPLIRKRIGEMVIDPLTYFSTSELCFTRHDKIMSLTEIQIYYLPVHPKDRDKKDSLAYSVLYAADSIFKIHSEFSRWALPDKIFCCFPYGIVPQQTIYEGRKSFSDLTNTIISYKGKTIKDGLMLPFTISKKDFLRCRSMIQQQHLNVWENSNYLGEKNNKKMFFSIEDVFSNIDFSKANFLEADWYNQIDSWDSYRDFLKSENSSKIKRYDIIYLKTKRKPYIFEEKENE